MSHMRTALTLVVVLLASMAGSLRANPAQVGSLFATGKPGDLAGLKLMEEVRRLVDIARPYQAEALIYQTLRRFPLHPEALSAADFLIARVSKDRSVSDEDRAEALQHACSLGIRTAQTWADSHSDAESAALGAYKLLKYQLTAAGGTLQERRRYAEELAGFIKKHENAKLAKRARREMVRIYMQTGQYRQALDIYERMMKDGVPLPASALSRCYYETGDFAGAVRQQLGPASWGPRLGVVRNWRDMMARLHFYLGNTAKGMELVNRGGALKRKSSTFVHVETDWQELPLFGKVNRSFELPPDARWVTDVQFRLQASYTAASHDLLAGRPVTAKITMGLLVEPVSVPKGKTDYKLSVLTPVSLETTVPYGAGRTEAGGFRTTWSGELVTTADDWVNRPKVWARARRGVLKNPPCRVWRTCEVLENNRVRVDIYVSTSYNSFITVDNRQALVEKPISMPESSRVTQNRTISMQIGPTEPVGGDGIGGSGRPEKPVCSYIARCFQDVKVYLPAVMVVNQAAPLGDTSTSPPARRWSWDVAGHVLTLESPHKFHVRKVSIKPVLRYKLLEIMEAAP